MNLRTGIIIVLTLFSSLSLYAQKTTVPALNDLYGEIVADSVRKDLAIRRVHTIQKVMNDGDHIMKATLDEKGRVIRYQYKDGFVADSMVYDDKDRLVKYIMISVNDIMSTLEFEYTATGEPTRYVTDAKRKHERLSYCKASHAGDTGIATTVYEQNGDVEVTKSWVKDGVSYFSTATKDKKGDETESRTFYTIYDESDGRKQSEHRIKETGELNLLKGLQDTLLSDAVNEEELRKNPEQVAALMAIGYSKEIGPEQKALIKKYFPDLAKYEGRREPDYKYVYDDRHSGRVSKYTGYSGTRMFSFTYNDKGRVSEVKEESAFSPTTETYIYDGNGLPQRIIRNGESKPEAVFKYDFYK